MSIDNGLNYTGQVFNVKDFGAKGDGVTDDTAAIKAALAAADQKDWASLYLPSGTYIISDTIIPGSKIRWLGDGKDITTIKAVDNFDKSYLISHIPSIPGWGANQTTFQSLTLDANRQGGSKIGTVTHLRSTLDLQYLNVKINAKGAIPFDLHNSTRVLIKNSDVIGKQSFLGSAKQVFIDHSNFFGTDYTESLLGGFGVSMISITNSTGQNLDNSNPNNGQWVKGRFFGDNPVWNISQYQYLGNNQTIDLAPPPADFNNDGKIDIDLNSGEQILWESNSPFLSPGVVTNSTANTITFDSSSSVNDTYHFTIVAGKGIGQSRQVKSFDSATNTYEIYDGWNILPDQSSVIVATKIVSKAVVYGNSLDGTQFGAYNSPMYTASSGVQAYHGASDLIIDNNSFHELRTGVYLWSGYNANDSKPLYFSQVTNNTFNDNLTGVSFPKISGEKGTSVLGSKIENNTVENVGTSFYIGINPTLTVTTNPFPNANMNVFENNVLTNVEQSSVFTQNNGSIDNTIWLQNSIF
jgi:hypothetical protein